MTYFTTGSTTYLTYPSTSTSATTGLVISSGINDIITNINIEDIISRYGIDLYNKKINAKNGWLVETPDGTLVKIDQKGNIQIEDNNAKIIYKANRIREFNKFLNASDLLENFIKFAGKNGAKQDNILTIPIEVFINWLIIEAAKFDGEPPPALPLKKPREYYRCLTCGKFIKKKLFQIAKFCNQDHYSKYLVRQ